MFATLKQIFNPKNKDIRKKIYFTLFALFIFKLGTAIVIPGINKAQLGLSTLKYFQLLNVMGGGALEQFSIFALGVSPYITASFIIQLLQMDIIPYLADLAKEGHTGQVKLNKITRYLGIVMAFIQGYMFSFAIIQGGSFEQYLKFALVMTAGTSLLLWLGDQMTQKGIGNGISMIIMAGILMTLPNTFVQAYQIFMEGATVAGIIKFVVYILLYIFIVLAVVFEENAERRVPIQYANKSTAVGGKQSYIPFRLNSAGVIPVIFASALLQMPAFIAQFFKVEKITSFTEKWLSTTSPTGFILYILLIFGFSYFYTYAQLKPKDMAENLQKNGGYIPGVRPGEATITYIKNVINHITFVGAALLALLAALPTIFVWITGLSSSIALGGTGLLIVVGVALETYKQLESLILSRNYTKGRR
ncbi:MAG: preprotein translocase subunit SecY [Erysipelotrichaceae bacterium]|nr:preprotein translocase subunit SecY [Erysipelotrichaceae bacterium]